MKKLCITLAMALGLTGCFEEPKQPKEDSKAETTVQTTSEETKSDNVTKTEKSDAEVKRAEENTHNESVKTAVLDEKTVTSTENTSANDEAKDTVTAPAEEAKKAVTKGTQMYHCGDVDN